MSELVAIRIRVHDLDADNVVRYFEEAARLNSVVPGFLGGRVYRLTTDTSDHLLLWHYSSTEAAEQGLVEVAKGRSMPQLQFVGHVPADVARSHVLRTGGVGIDGLADGPYLSLSKRIADPGFGPDLVEELDNIFLELQYLEGFRGYMIGVNETLPEEILGLATWSTPSAFAASLPAGVLYEVELFGLVATSSAFRART